MSHHSGVFFDLWRATPVFHGFDFDRTIKQDDGVYRDFTRCGRVIAKYDPVTQRHLDYAKWIPMIHARKIGRPCRICFPAKTTEQA